MYIYIYIYTFFFIINYYHHRYLIIHRFQITGKHVSKDTLNREMNSTHSRDIFHFACTRIKLLFDEEMHKYIYTIYTIILLIIPTRVYKIYMCIMYIYISLYPPVFSCVFVEFVRSCTIRNAHT